MRSLRIRHWSVRARILAAMLLITALSMAGAGFVAYLVQRDRVMHEIDDRLLAKVEAVRVVMSGVSPTDVSGGAEAAPTVTAYPNTRAALQAVFSRVLPGPNESSLGIIDGAPALVSSVEGALHLQDDPALVERIVGEVSDGSVRLGTAVSPLGNLRYIAVPLTVAGDTQQGVYVDAFDIDAELRDSVSAFSSYAIVAAGGLVAVGVAGWFVSGRLSRPLRELREAASRITASDLSERIPVQGHDDVSELTETVNTMLDRIDGAVQSQLQLLNDVRHELKTPITIVRGQLEVADPSDPRDVRQAIAIAIDELDRMSELVDEIEALADSQETMLTRTPVDVADFSEQVFSKASSIGDHDWSLAEAAHAVAVFDASRVTQAWLQLADNAAKYSEPGKPVSLGSRVIDGETVEFWVADQGPGIPSELESRIFERFGRVGANRRVDGSGLGLPIVAAIAKAHGGKVTLHTSPLGSRFGIQIPLVQEVPE